MQKGKLQAKSIRFTTKKRIPKPIRDEFNLKAQPFAPKILNEKSSQLENVHWSQLAKGNNKLMVLGSGVEEERG
ncbi:MAG: hypothetical protein KDD45_13135 [Bdellovibrionales bacterium]|nr:hypothetical protein [Bdellovibrionales bacterium]